MEKLKSYIVEFNKDDTMKNKKYLLDCIVGRGIWWPIIVIIYDECTLFANDGICKAWTWVGNTFLRPKRHGQGIMVSEFLFPFSWLNLLSLFQEKQKQIIEKTRLTILGTVELFEYKKNNKRYWYRAIIYKQVVSKALLIAEVFYPGYLLLFLFDNATSHFVYADNALCWKCSYIVPAYLRNAFPPSHVSDVSFMVSSIVS